MNAPFYCVRVVDGRHVVGYTTDGCDFYALPRAAFGNPRDAIRYAEMRQRAVSPLRVADDEVAEPVSVIPPLSSATPSGLTAVGYSPSPSS